MPQKSLLCDSKLKELGVYGSFTFLDELSIFWYPLDADVISMESVNTFRKLHLEGDTTVLNPVAKGLLGIQAIYGTIPNVYGMGQGAREVFDYMTKLRRERVHEEPQDHPEIDTLIILDRKIDLISPLVTQLTYEGLIDEMFGIKNSSVKLPANKFLSPDSPTEEGGLDNEPVNPFDNEVVLKTVPLNSNEDMFNEIRDKNFNAVGPTLSRKAKTVSAQFEERHEAKSVRELKNFVERLPQMKIMKQSLATHTTIAEMIKEGTDNRKFLEALQVEQELLNYSNTDRQHPFVEEAGLWGIALSKVLKIACLQSVVNSGLKPKVLHAYRKEMLDAYGHQHLNTLHNLEKVGLLQAQGTNRNYAVLRKRLRLTMDDVDEQNPKDIAYVHSVYAPLSIRLISSFEHPGWKSIRDILELLPGPVLEEKQAIPQIAKKNPRAGNMKKTLVLFVGGCTYAEISALRFLSQQEDANSEFLVATTSIINGESFIKSLMDNIENALE